MIVGSGAVWFVVLVGLLLAGMTVYSSIVTIRPTEVAAYTVVGEFRGMLDPGMHFIVPFVGDIHRYERLPEFTVTEAANTADGGRVEATVRVELERGDIRRGYETDAGDVLYPIAKLESEAGDLLRAALRDRDTETVLSAHVDIERALARGLRESAREHYYHLDTVDALRIERAERPPAPER